MLPEPGQIVRVRSRQYLVDDVEDPVEPGDDRLVRLSCLDDDAQGDPLEVLWERELDAEVVSGVSWGRVARRGFDDPRVFSAWLNAVRWNCVTSTTPRLFQAPYRAGIEVMAYQLEPLRKALLLPRVNLFVADDVGLGKTIEAGLITRELIMRQKVRRIVVACPPSVVLQWRDELDARFGLRFVVFDRDYVLERRRERGYGINPWSTHSRFVISHALLRDETYAGPLRDWLTADEKPGEPRGTLLILDEAHNAAPASGSKYAIDSRFTRVVRELAPLFEHRLFLSATPHNGHSNSFSALLEILDPHRFCRGVKVVPRHLDAVMVRRLKADLREVAVAFPQRVVKQIDIDGLPDDAPDLVLAQLLSEYAELREERVKDASKTARAAASIVVTALQKRLLSSIEAFASTLQVHRRAVERGIGEARQKARAAELPQRSLFDAPGADDDRAEMSEDELRTEQLAAVEMATRSSMRDAPAGHREQELLAQMTEIAEQSRGLPDPRVKKLIAWLRESCCPGEPPVWNERRVLIFTEYNDSKRYLDEQLREAFAGTDRADLRIATFHGGMDQEAREDIKRAFNADPSSHPLRILIATDAAREGVNLQNHCADLFHFDMPWNPSRMEQRNGRIDRKLQRASEVRCHYFVFTQRPEDRVLQTLVRKTRNIQTELGSLSSVLEARLGRLLDGGIRRRDAQRLIEAIDTEDLATDQRSVVDEELEQATRVRRALLTQQLSSLRDLMAQARETLSLDEDHLRLALSSGLELAGGHRLEPSPDRPGSWRMHPEDRLRKDPGWAETLDTLRAPRSRDEKLWDWRKTSPVRPVVFHDPGEIDEHVVHLHLEHRLVQRLLGRFLAQGFVYDDLSRATVLMTQDPIPRVLLLGRLSLYGDRASRLHDELLTVSARWVDPSVRGEALKPYADDTKTMALLDAALKAPAQAPEVVTKRLAGEVQRDVDELAGHLQAAGGRRADRAEELLCSRGDREKKELVDVLESQRKRIQAMLDETTTPQLSLTFKGFNDDERRQLEADQRHWRKRLSQLDAELQAEPERIVRGYQVRARRVDPIGVVYLWPVTG